MSAALAYLLRRLGWALVLIAGITTLSFVVSQLLPGDPARMTLGPQASAADVAQARAIYGLDQPIREQYRRYLTRLIHLGPSVIDPKKDLDHRSCGSVGVGLHLHLHLHLDLGFSFFYRKPVVDLLAAKIPRSFELAVAALLLQLLFGVGLGTFAASRRHTAWDEAATGLTLLGVSAPTFLSGLLLQYVFAYKLGVLPYDGYGTSSADHLRSLVLPALTLGLFGSALYARLTRDELGALLDQDFIRAARGRGASGSRVLVVHALRNALLPLATLAALDFGTLVGGAVVTERVFRWPGLGQMAVDAVLNRDGPVIFGTVLFASTAVIASTLVLDLLLVALDPRLRSKSH
ncbi:MAG: ABC transporter permease [Minicystis sp.]